MLLLKIVFLGWIDEQKGVFMDSEGGQNVCIRNASHLAHSEVKLAPIMLEIHGTTELHLSGFSVD